MNIQVIGSGCPTCKKLYDLTKESAKELGLPLEVEYIKDIQKAVALGAMAMPCLAVNSRLVLSGMVPGKEKIKKLIQDNIA